jgi:hypothetical protein
VDAGSCKRRERQRLRLISIPHTAQLYTASRTPDWSESMWLSWLTNHKTWPCAPAMVRETDLSWNICVSCNITSQ